MKEIKAMGIGIVEPKERYLSTFNRTQAEDPLKTFDFILEIEGFAYAGFTKCSGLSAKTEVIKYGIGGGIFRKSPGMTDFPELTFERGQILAAGYGNRDFMDWYKQVHNTSLHRPARGKNVIRRTIEIVQFGPEGDEKMRWRVVECWPSEFKPMSDLSTEESKDSFQSLVIVNEGFGLVTNL